MKCISKTSKLKFSVLFRALELQVWQNSLRINPLGYEKPRPANVSVLCPSPARSWHGADVAASLALLDKLVAVLKWDVLETVKSLCGQGFERIGCWQGASITDIVPPERIVIEKALYYFRPHSKKNYEFCKNTMEASSPIDAPNRLKMEMTVWSFPDP